VIEAGVVFGDAVPRWKFGGHNIPRQDSWPVWLCDHFGGVRSVRVFSDDTIEPKSRATNMPDAHSSD
jgi:hypothetical protein